MFLDSSSHHWYPINYEHEFWYDIHNIWTRNFGYQLQVILTAYKWAGDTINQQLNSPFPCIERRISSQVSFPPLKVELSQIVTEDCPKLKIVSPTIQKKFKISEPTTLKYQSTQWAKQYTIMVRCNILLFFTKKILLTHIRTIPEYQECLLNRRFSPSWS